MRNQRKNTKFAPKINEATCKSKNEVKSLIFHTLFESETRVEIFNFHRSDTTDSTVLGFIKIPKTPRDSKKNINKALRSEIAFHKEWIH